MNLFCQVLESFMSSASSLLALGLLLIHAHVFGGNVYSQIFTVGVVDVTYLAPIRLYLHVDNIDMLDQSAVVLHEPVAMGTLKLLLLSVVVVHSDMPLQFRAGQEALVAMFAMIVFLF